MKKVWNSFFAAVIVSLVLSSLAASSFADQGRINLSKSELKALLTTAKTPAEHRAIAAYYEQRAKDLTAESAEHQAMAEQFAKQPATIESKQGIGASHCRRFAQIYAIEAKEAANRAAEHEAMAVKAETK